MKSSNDNKMWINRDMSFVSNHWNANSKQYPISNNTIFVYNQNDNRNRTIMRKENNNCSQYLSIDDNDKDNENNDWNIHMGIFISKRKGTTHCNNIIVGNTIVVIDQWKHLINGFWKQYQRHYYLDRLNRR